MTYALLIYRSHVELTPSDEERVLEAHRELQRRLKRDGELHAVAKLEEPTTGRQLRMLQGKAEVTDGPYIESKEWLVGFYLLDCVSEAVALERAAQICPAGGHHAIEVRPVAWHDVPQSSATP